jgi:hypothetical protein
MSTDARTSAELEAFWLKVARSEPGHCWPWVGGQYINGYGRVKNTTAHRYLWSLLYGQPHPDLEVCHHCDNRICCNPEHLFLGTPMDNAQDKMRKGRVARMNGERNGSCKLTVAQVEAIRQSTLGHRETARAYGVSESNVRMIRRLETWRVL